MLHNLLKNTYTYRQCKRQWRPCFNGIRLKLIILFTKPYVFESNWMLRTVSLRADPTPRDSQSLDTDVWYACLTFCPPSHSYIKDKLPKSETCLWWLRGAAADETKKLMGWILCGNVSGSGVRKLAINSNSVSSAGKRPGRLCRTPGP